MSEFKTKAEITAANEFIGYLEQLKSGGAAQGTPGVGTNRALERLSENVDVVLDLALTAQTSQLLYNGDFNYDAGTGTLNFTSAGNIGILFGEAVGAASFNLVVAPVSPVPGTSGVIYLVLDRTTEGAVLTFSTAASMAAYNAIVAAALNRADHFLFAIGLAGSSSIVLFDGRHIRGSFPITNSGATDTQYGQQSELTQVRNQQMDNLKLMLVGGGDISWDISGPNIMAWTGTFQMLFPAQGTGKFELSAGSKTLAPGEVAYLTLDRDASSGPITDASLGVIAIGSLVETDDTFVLAYHNATDTKLYMWDGTSLNDGDVVQLGGVRSGVQWFFKGAGTAAAGTPAIPNGQITDFITLGPGTSFKVGTGELMVYRNGVKARASLVSWEGGTYPGGGALTGPVEDYDEYVEEDPNSDGTGTRIIWLRDNTPDGAVGHPSTAHDPPWTWPKTLATGEPDFLEAFVGIQGNQRSVSNVDGIYGFEMVTTEAGGARVWTGGGVLVTSGDPYHHLSGSNIFADPSTDIVPPESLTAPGWAYLYLKPGSVFGGSPELVFSDRAPEVGNLGVHPVEADHRFISSVYMDTVSQVRGFSKMGPYVSMSRGVQAFGSPAAAGTVWPAPNAAWQEVILAGTTPDTWPGTVRLRVGYNIASFVANGAAVGIRIRGTGYADTGRAIAAVKPASGVMYLEFDVPLLTDSKFEILQDSTEITSVDSVEMIGYYEGRHSTALEMGV